MPKPAPNRETPAGEDPRVAQFLAKAGPIIAAYRGLTPNCRRQLTDVARSLGLTDSQMAAALKLSQVSGQTAAADSPENTATAQEEETVWSAPLKSPTKPPPLPRRQAHDEASAPSVGAEAAGGSATHPVEPPPVVATAVPAAAAEDSTITSRPHSPVPQPPPAPGEESLAAGATPVSTGAEPVPPPPPPAPEPAGPKPREAFCAELRKAFAKVRKSGALSEQAEQKLATTGQASFRLAEIYARHLVYIVAAECSVPVISQVRAMRQQGGGVDEEREQKIREFLERAAPIIAEQRGINVRSRVKMGAVARELGLSDEEMEQALKSLQSSGDTPEQEVKWLVEREEAFRRHLNRKLAKRAGAILTFIDERRYIENGSDRYGVGEAFVRETLRSLMTEHKIRFISAKQAHEHVARLIDDRVGASNRILPGDRRRLHREGAQWGLSPADVDAVIEEKHIEFDDEARGQQTRRLVLAVTAAILVLGIVGGLAAVLLYYGSTWRKPDGEIVGVKDPPDNGGPVEPESPPVVPETPSGPPNWWDSTLAASVVGVQTTLPHCEEILDGIRSTDPADRSEAYRALVGHVTDPVPPGVPGVDPRREIQQQHIEGVLKGCYALDPSDEAAAGLREALMGLVPQPHSELSDDVRVLHRAFWAVRTAASALDYKGISEARAQDLMRAISRAVGKAIRPSDGPGGTRLAARQALCEHFYRLLIAAAPGQPELVLQLHAELTLKAAECLATAAREALDTDLLVALLPAVGDGYLACKDLIESCVGSRDPLNVLKIVDAYERLDNENLKAFLRTPLLIRARISKDMTDAEVANAVREALGATARVGPATAEERWRTFQEKADEALADLTSPPDDAGRLLTEVVRLQYASTLGCALAQQELGFATFDEVLERKRETLAPPPAGMAGATPLRRGGRRPPVDERNLANARMRRVQQHVGVLRNYGRNNAYIRYIAVEGLAVLSRDLPQIDPRSGNDIAAYLLMSKTVAEHEQIRRFVKDLARWRNVRIGLADALTTSRLRKQHLQEVLSAALGRELKLDDDGDWEPRVRRELLLSVATELTGPAGPVSGASTVYDRFSNLLHDYYTIQSRLVGVLPAKYMATDSPEAVLRLLVDHEAARLSGRVQRPADREYLDQLPHHLTVAEYVGDDGVRQTLMLERIWLRLLAAGVALEQPDRAADADQLVAELLERDAEAKHLLAQLRDGHEMILRLWLLSAKP
jgi:hypothetical protein